MSTPYYRYPGLKPFNPDEKAFFFGRDKEKKEVCRLLDLDNLVVLHSKSGLGKSSLINAAILPELKEIREWKEEYELIQIRLTNYDPNLAKIRRKESHEQAGEEDDWVKDPVDRFISKFITSPDAWEYLWKTHIPIARESFWLAVKWKLANLPKTKRVVLVLDQFEELFTYPDKRVEEFARNLGELYHRILPESIRAGIERKKLLDADNAEPGSSESPSMEERVLMDTLIKDIEEPLDIKILISMRSDKLNYLERFKPYLPEMMLSSYELRSFDREQATQAIVEPAKIEGKGFASPAWEYSEYQLSEILTFLQDRLSKRIDPSSLQIICQHIENTIIKKVKKAERKKKPLLDRIFHA